MKSVFIATSWTKFAKSHKDKFEALLRYFVAILIPFFSITTESVFAKSHQQSKKGQNTSRVERADHRNCTPQIAGARTLSESHIEIRCVSESISASSSQNGSFPPSLVKENELVGLVSNKGKIVGLFQKVEISRTNRDDRDREGINEQNSFQSGESDSSSFERTRSEGALTFKLLSLNSNRLFQDEDRFVLLNLNKVDENLLGTTFLLKDSIVKRSYDSRYKPLYTQGTTIGDTAQTLFDDEWFFSLYGTLAYGFHSKVTGSTNLWGLALGSPNAQMKTKFYQNETQTWAMSINMAQERDSSERLFNIDLIWDSVLSDKLISHSLISAAVISFDSAKDIAAVKSYGSSSFQTGYEYILDDWSRFLIGPSYNIDKRALGGYVGYLKTFSHFHGQISLTSNNIRRFQFSAEEGYLIVLDAYWRW